MAASGHAGEDWDVTVASLPIRSPGHPALAALLLVLASVWLAAAIRGALGGDPAIIPGLGASGGYVAAAVGIALALLAAHWMLRRQTVIITRGALVVTERSLLRRRAWREPLSSYREIRCHVEQQRHRYGRRSWYVARLWHPEPGRRVELARARDLAMMAERARDCARRLGLPLVWQQGPPFMADQAGVHGAEPHERGEARGDVAASAGPRRSVSAT
ncbi:MAG TPA: hypothetical protein VHK45_02195 [Geminicoccaceae bacterium]|nr:hypothetical protein [Geminicoccaceae bacterium]